MEDKDLEKAMYRWFDMKYELYSRLDHNDSIYLYYDGAECADIRILKRSESIYYKWEFWEEFSDVFPIQRIYFEWIISKWVGDTFNLKEFTPNREKYSCTSRLKIPII